MPSSTALLLYLIGSGSDQLGRDILLFLKEKPPLIDGVR